MGWQIPAMIGMQALGSAMNQPQKQAEGRSRYTSMDQAALLSGLQRRVPGMLAGSGEFGFGQAMKQGTGQLNQMMADRGISGGMGGGLYAGLLGNLTMQAGAQDMNNRRQMALQLAGMAPQVTTTQGWFKGHGPGRPQPVGIERDQMWGA